MSFFPHAWLSNNLIQLCDFSFEDFCMLGCWTILSSLRPSLPIVAADRLEADLLSIARQHPNHSCPILGLTVLVFSSLVQPKNRTTHKFSDISVKAVQLRFHVIYIYTCISGCLQETHTKIRMPKCMGGITWPKHAHAQSQFWAVRVDL